MNLLGRRKWWWLAFSGLLAGLGLVSLLVWHLRIGLDFKGGSLLDVTSDQAIDKSAVIQELAQAGVHNLSVQPAGKRELLIKSAAIGETEHTAVNRVLASHSLKERRFENVGPIVGRDLTNKAIMAVVIASAAIILYVAYSFRNVPRPASSWRFGVTAVLALVHDLFITVGIFALLGHLFGYEIDALFVTALLTIMGFSVHDTIVVFDRLRENMRRDPIASSAQFESVANASLIQTLNRSLNTSLTVIMVLLAMALLGGDTIRPFMITLLIGVTVGTYSSIATATPLLIIWQEWIMRRSGQKTA